MSDAISTFFRDLTAIHGFLLAAVPVTDPDLKTFSLQPLSVVVPRTSDQQNLSAFCQAQHIGTPLPNDFSDLTKNFVAFLDAFTPSIDNSIANLIQVDAIVNAPAGTVIQPVFQMVKQSLQSLFGASPFASNIGLQAIDSDLAQRISSHFYTPGGSMLLPSSQTVLQFIGAVLS